MKNQRNDKGKRHGYWEHIYSSSLDLVSAKGNYINGKRHGYWEAFHRNGKLYWVGSFNNGKLVGYWEWYNKNNKGELIEKQFYL